MSQRTRRVCLQLLTILAVLPCAGISHRELTLAPRDDAADPSGRQCFVQISDTHHGHPLHQIRLRQAIDRINALPFPVDFVLHTGDLASDNLANPGVAAAISNEFARLNMPVVFVAGNHDLLPRRLDETLQAYRTFLGPLATRVNTPGFVLLALYTEPLRKKEASVPGYDALEWLGTQLSGTGDRPVILAHHTPDQPDFYRDQIHEGWPAESRRRWLETLSGGRVVAVLAGHFHRDELHWNELGIPTYVASSVACFWGRQGSFRIYFYEKGRLSYHTVYLDDPPSGGAP